VGNPIPFVVAAAERNTFVQTALHDGATCRIDLFDASDRAARHHDARDRRNHEHQGDDENHGGLDVPGGAFDIDNSLANTKWIAVWQDTCRGAHERHVRSLRRRIAGAKFARCRSTRQRTRTAIRSAAFSTRAMSQTERWNCWQKPWACWSTSARLRTR